MAGSAPEITPARSSAAQAAGGTAAAAPAARAALSPLSLAFCSAALEDAYMAEWRAHPAHLRHDAYGALASLLQLAPGTIFIVLNGIQSCWTLVLLSWALHLVHLYLLLARPRAHYQRHRLTIVAAGLTVGRLLTATLIPACDADTSATTRWLYKTGLIPLVWYFLILPLPFRYQAPAQAAAVLLYLWRLVGSGCQLILEDPGALPVVQRIQDTVQAGAALMLGAPVAALGSGAGRGSGLQACWAAMASLHVLVGLVLLLPVSYVRELRARRLFLEQRQRQQRQQGQQGQQHVGAGDARGCDVLDVPVMAVALVAASLGAAAVAALAVWAPSLQRLMDAGKDMQACARN